MVLRELRKKIPYKYWENVRQKMYRHTRGIGIYNYLKKQRPNEPDDVLDFRVKTLNKLTKDVFRKGMNNAKKMLLDTPLIFDCNEDLKQIALGDNFKSKNDGYTDLYTLLIDYLQFIIEDPNGLLVVIPIALSEEIIPSFAPQNERIYYHVDYVNSKEIYFKSDDYNIYHWKNYLIKDSLNTMYYLTELNDGTYTENIWYNHETGHKLSTEMGGYDTSNEDDKSYLDSFFDGAVEFADAFMNQYENLKAEMLQNSFPIREFREMPCNQCDGVGTIIHNEKEIECKTCNGTKKMLHYNSNSIFIRPKTNSLIDTDKKAQDDPLIQYYSPPMNGTQLNYTFSFDLYERAGEAIGATVTKMAQSGVAKQEDKESYYSMLSQIMYNMVRLYQFSLSCMQSILFMDWETPIRVNPSKDIKLNSTDYVLNVIKNLETAGVPKEIVSSQLSELMEKTTNSSESVIIKLLPIVDILYGKNSQDIVMLKSLTNTPVTPKALFINMNAYSIFKEIDLKQDKDVILSEFRRIAEERYNEFQNENQPLKIGDFE